MYTHLHSHTAYSLSDGLFSPKQWAKAIKDRGLKAHAITDHGTLAGCLPFYYAMREEGLQPIIGAEFYFADVPTQKDEEGRSSAHLILLAKNVEGWQNLLRLSKLSWSEGFYYKPRIGLEWLAKHSDGLICLTACLGGVLSREVWREMDKKPTPGLEKRFQTLSNIFGKDLYVEFQGHNDDKQRMVHDNFITRLSGLEGFQPVITNDCHYILPEHAKVQDLIKNAAYGKSEAAQSYTSFNSLWLKKPADIYETFRHNHTNLDTRFIVNGMRSTEEIAEKCINFEIPKKQYLPRFSESEDSNELFKKLTTIALKRFLDRPESLLHATKAEYVERFKKEYGVITKYGLADYFLIVWDICRWARMKGIYVGIGRGSSAGSLIAYLLEIVKLNPLQYKLLFERFLNANRAENGEPPDVDMDFESERREEVKKYIFDRYGRERVCEIGSYGRMMLKTAILDFGKQYGFESRELHQITTNLGLDKEDAQSLDAAMDNSPKLKSMMKKNPDYEMAVRAINGQIKNQSIHPAGVIISSEPIDQVTPLKTQKKTGSDERHIVTQCEDKYVIAQGLLKMDVLGLQEYDIFKFVVAHSDGELTHENYFDKIHDAEVAEPDAAVWELFRTGKTEAVFQFGCLSGDTVICIRTKKTIKEVYEQECKKHGSTQLTALLLDEGAWRRSSIAAIKPTGLKQTYRLVTSDRRFIRATADHKFLTDDGWKTLGDLRPGDKVGFKADWGDPRLDGLRLCGDCGSEKSGGASRCYACSARHHSNPTHHREKLRKPKSVSNIWSMGGISKTRLDSMLKKRAVTWAATLASGWVNPAKGRSRPDLAGRNNPMFGRTTKSRMGFRADLGHFVRSTWEADFCRVMRHLGIEYRYEPETFDLGEISYTPDFYIPSEDRYVEIKGWMTEGSLRRIALFRSRHPDKRLDVINRTEFAEMALKYKHLVAWECPKFPLGFVWEVIDRIEPFGEEETFDLCMANSAHNYVANGFVTHNSDGMKQLLIDMKADRISDLIAAVALYRPGCLENGWHTQYYRRKAGDEEVKYAHPVLADALSDTYGVCVYQEQFMETFHKLGDVSLVDADLIRSALGKKDKEKLAKFKKQFVKAAAKKMGSEEAAAAEWDKLAKAANYTFNRSHSAVYGLVAYCSQWFKVHYPVPYWTSVLDWNCMKKKWDEILINKRAAADMGVTPLMPDINHSRVRFIVDGGRPRWSLCGIAGIGEKAATVIVEAQPFASFEDFHKRVHKGAVKFNNIEALIYAGAFDALGDRSEMLEQLYRLHNGKKSAKTKKRMPKLTPEHFLREYYRVIGFFEQRLRTVFPDFHKNCQSEAEIVSTIAGEPVLVGGMVSEVTTFRTRKGEAMGRVILVDADERIEVTIFPRQWAKYRAYLREGRLLQIAGEKSDYNGRQNQVAAEEIEVIGLEAHARDTEDPDDIEY